MNVCLNTCLACIGPAIRAFFILAAAAPRMVLAFWQSHGIHAIGAQHLRWVQSAAAWLCIPPAKRQAMALVKVAP